MRLIDADALIKKLESNSWDIDEWELPHEQISAGLMANAMDRETVEGMPTVDAVPVRHGKWIDIDVQLYTWKVRCSVCGHERSMMSTQGEYPKYCEACGARMDEK